MNGHYCRARCVIVIDVGQVTCCLPYLMWNTVLDTSHWHQASDLCCEPERVMYRAVSLSLCMIYVGLCDE